MERESLLYIIRESIRTEAYTFLEYETHQLYLMTLNLRAAGMKRSTYVTRLHRKLEGGEHMTTGRHLSNCDVKYN